MIRIYPSVFRGNITAPASKDVAQRLLFASSLPPTPTTVENVPSCRDVDTAIECLERFGCRINRSGSDVYIEPFPKTSPAAVLNLDFGQSDAAACMSLALAASYGYRVNCRASEILTKRHMLPLTSRMALRGVTLSSFSLPLEMQGRLEGGSYSFKGDEGSQFISAFMMALPLLRADSSIRINGELYDEELVRSTISVLSSFGIKTEEVPGGWDVKGGQIYESPGSIVCENDWALASSWICAAALSAPSGGDITVGGLREDSAQRYRNISPLIALISQDFKEIEIDLKDAPDLATIVCAAAYFKRAKIRINGVPELRERETNRLRTMSAVLGELGCRTEYTDSSISVDAADRPDHTASTVVDCRQDPWIFLSFALCGGVMDGPIILSDERYISKIYEDFLRDYAALGGSFEPVSK
ncbi:MAG: hypothetical protein II971_05855 [Firmicutes bacterium]|nr:hypothetical protein [Bacillota bacterium]